MRGPQAIATKELECLRLVFIICPSCGSWLHQPGLGDPRQISSWEYEINQVTNSAPYITSYMPVHTGSSFSFQATVKSPAVVLTKSQTYRLWIIYYISTEMLFAAIKRTPWFNGEALSKSYYKPWLQEMLPGLANFVHGLWILADFYL